MGKRLSFLDFPSDLPRYGQVNPYGSGQKQIIQTLGRFQSTPQTDGKFVNIRDTYDMVNPQEDPDCRARPRKRYSHRRCRRPGCFQADLAEGS